MKRHFVTALVGFTLLAFSFSGCSEKNEAELEGETAQKGAIEKMTDEAADVIVKKIRTPMDRAHSVKEIEEERARAMDEALDEK
jgi:hypothetical protein